MRLIDRAAKAASLARTQLAEVRDLRAEASIAPVAPPPLDDHAEDVLEHAREHGAPDPSILLTAAEASEVCGQLLGGPHLTYGDDLLGVRFEAAASDRRRWSATVSAFHGTDGRAFDAGAHWFGFLADVLADDGVAVPGLGQAAIAREHDLHVLADPLVLHVEVETPHGDDGARRIELARRVLGRLGL